MLLGCAFNIVFVVQKVIWKNGEKRMKMEKNHLKNDPLSLCFLFCVLLTLSAPFFKDPSQFSFFHHHLENETDTKAPFYPPKRTLLETSSTKNKSVTEGELNIRNGFKSRNTTCFRVDTLTTKLQHQQLNESAEEKRKEIIGRNDLKAIAFKAKFWWWRRFLEETSIEKGLLFASIDCLSHRFRNHSSRSWISFFPPLNWNHP